MAKNQKQRLYDDLNDLVNKYPNMYAGDFIDILDVFGRAMFRCLPKITGKTKRVVTLRHRTRTYRLG